MVVDDGMVDNDDMVEDDGDDGIGAKTELIGMISGTDARKCLPAGGPKSGTGKSMVMDSRAKKIKLELKGIIGSKNIEDYFHFVGTDSLGS